MTNREKVTKEIIASVNIDDDFIFSVFCSMLCKKRNCGESTFRFYSQECKDEFKKWLDEEAKEEELLQEAL